MQVALVTGGAGFVGANLVRRLLKEKYDVHLIVKRSTDLSRIRDVECHTVTLHRVSLTDQRGLRRLMEEVSPSLIFHLAAHGSNSYQTDVGKIAKTNILGTLSLLLASSDVPYDAFINTGTSSEYGFKNKPMQESDLLEPTSFYAAAKASATLIAQVFARTYQKPIVTIRPFSAYGPYEDPRRFVPTIIRNIIEGKPIKLTPGSQRRDFIYIDDVIDAYLVAAKRAKLLSGMTVNVGTGKQHTNDEVVSTLFRVTGKQVVIEKGAYPSRSWDTRCWVADLSRAKKLLGWKPKVTLAEGLLRTYKWYKSQPRTTSEESKATSEVTDSPGEALAKRGWAPRR